MSVKKCIAVQCPHLSIIVKSKNRGQFTCESGKKEKTVLVSEVIQAAKEYNKKVKNPIEACSFWEGHQECSEAEYRKTTRNLWKQVQSLEM